MKKGEKKLPEVLRKAILDNLEWIINDSEILNRLLILENKNQNHKVVDLRDLILKKMKLDFKSLTKIHETTVSAAYNNFLGSSKLHQCILHALDQRSLQGLLDALDGNIRKILGASKIELCLYSEVFPSLEHKNWKLLCKSEMVDLLKFVNLSNKKIVSLSSEPKYDWKKERGATNKVQVASEAFLNLSFYLCRDEQAILAIGSNKKETFSSKKRTDYLKILAKVVSHKLNILLTTQRIAYE